MQVFTRSTPQKVKSILYSLCGGFTALVLAAAAGAGLPVYLAAAVAALAFFAWLFVYGEDIRIEVLEDGVFYYYKAGRLKQKIVLAQVNTSVAQRFRPGSRLAKADCSLVFSPKRSEGQGAAGAGQGAAGAGQGAAGAGQGKLRIDCAPLGGAQFTQLCAAILRY